MKLNCFMEGLRELQSAPPNPLIVMFGLFDLCSRVLF